MHYKETRVPFETTYFLLSTESSIVEVYAEFFIFLSMQGIIWHSFFQDFALKTVKETHEFWKALISKKTNAGELNW